MWSLEVKMFYYVIMADVQYMSIYNGQTPESRHDASNHQLN